MKNRILFIALMLLMGAQTAVNAQELTVSDIQNSGCLRGVKPSMDSRKKTNEEYEESEYGGTRTIVLTKEGSSLKVQLFNVESNCCTSGFGVRSTMKDGNETTPCTVSVGVYSNDDLLCDCICPYNISFTIQDIEPNSFKFSCWWYQGLVNLTEGEPLILEDITENVSKDGIVYSVHKSMLVAKLVNGKTWKGELNIPSEVSLEGKNYPVTSIDYNAFKDNTTLTAVTIPNSVTSIGGYSFRGCSDLTSVVIPESVPNIPAGIFYQCSNLTSVNIPKNVKTIGSSAFKGCSSLADITIPNSVTSIGEGAFDGTAWYNNQPDGVVYLGKFAYKYKGTMPEGTHISINEGTTGIACNAFHGCSGMTSVTIPESMTSIGDYAFGSCNSLISVNIPNGVTNIGQWAFEGCSSLTSVNIPEGVTRINFSTFRNCGSLKSIVIPQNVTSIGSHAFLDCITLASVTISEGVKEIESSVFENCRSLTSIDIPKGVTRIEYYSFKDCSSLTSVKIPEGVEVIDDCAFQGCSSLTSVNIPKSVTYINRLAFGNCTNLASVTISEGLEYIGAYAFRNCNNLVDVYCYANNIPIGNYAFEECPIASATLHVPAGSEEKYKTTSPWSEFGNIVAIAQDSSPTLEDLLAEAESLLFGCSYVRSSQGTKKAVLYYSIKEKEEIEGIKYSNLFIDVVELSALQDGIHEMVFIDEKYPGEPTCTDVLLIRQDGDKVYCQTEDDTQEWLILDFGLKMGDIFVNGAGERFLVKEITKSEDSKRKRILLISEDGTQEDTWEEGIGSLQWGFLPNYVVKTLKYFQDVEDSMFTNLWAAANPDYFVEQGVYDEYFKLQPFDEIKDEEAEDMTLEDLPDSPLSYSFIEDSLRIQGYYPLNLYPNFAAASITGGHIDISIHQVTGLDIIKGYHIAKIDVRIPGFKAGTYEVGMPGQEYVTLECKGSSAQYNDPVTFTKDQMATIILPTMPDASKGKYYRLDRVEDGQIIFEQELQPQARVPYIIVPDEDFSIDPSTLNLEGLTQDEVSIEGVSFTGSYHREELSALTGGDGEGSSYIDLIDTTSDCGVTISAETGKEVLFIGALRAYLIVSWDDPINPGGARSPKDKLEIVLKDFKTGVGDAPRLNDKGQMKNEKWYDLQGRQINNSNFKIQNSSQSSGAGGAKLPRGIYIKDKKKVLY